MSKSYKYPKSEKLKSKKAIDMLFSNGKTINAFPIRVIYIQKPKSENSLIHTGVTVSKKNIKLAVNRNLLKRRMREAYRLNSHPLKKSLIQHEKEMDLMFIYSSKDILPYSLIENKIKVLLTRLTDLV